MATITQLGIPGVGSGILHPKLQHKWRCVFVGLGAEGSNTLPVSHQVTQFRRPQLSFSETELHRYNSRAYVAGKHEWAETSIVIEDDITSSASRIINDQVSKQQFLIGAEGPWLGSAEEGSLYKFAIKLEMLDGKEQVVETWVLQGCFVKSVEYGELDYKSSEAVTITLGVRFDHAYQEFGSYSAGQGVALGGSGT